MRVKKKAGKPACAWNRCATVFGQLFLKTKAADAGTAGCDRAAVGRRIHPRGAAPPGPAHFRSRIFFARRDRNYIVLDLAAEDSWRAVSHDFARLFLSFNYPADPGLVRRRLRAIFLQPASWATARRRLAAIPRRTCPGTMHFPAHRRRIPSRPNICGIAERAVASPAGFVHDASQVLPAIRPCSTRSRGS